MDKYIVRTPRDKQPVRKPREPDQELKQATILSLKRVVVVEDIKKAKVLLETAEDKDTLLQELTKLQRKIPSKKVLEETKIGLSLNKLRKHSDKDVSTLATTIYRHWKAHFKDHLDKPKIEVRFDDDTNKFRQSARRMIENSLSQSEDATLLAEAIERCAFGLNCNTRSHYKRHIRRIVFTLRHQPDVKSRVLNKTLTVQDFCQMKADP